MNKTIKAILFDLDNTLINFSEFKKRATKAAAQAMKNAGLEGKTREIEDNLIDFYFRHGIESDDAFQKFLEKHTGRVEYRILASGINAYLKEKYRRLEPYPGTRETLEELRDRGYGLGIVSDGLRLKAWMRLVESDLDEFFQVVVTYDDTGEQKPNRKPFLKACRELVVEPGDCLFVGDWPERDIVGAGRAGMKTCLALYGGNKGEADYVIEDVRDLPRLLD
ncbi:MAG: TIGR02253 family HAD-type hydrolase [Candidatus Altiarchaeota archaeon]|nr:TIGR02253 family HAD-type hydrolase [Candidatus Altiarchaeota archaeon]